MVFAGKSPKSISTAALGAEASDSPNARTAADSLARFANRVDTSVRGEPAVLGVIVGSGYGYVRSDGIHVIPVGALGP